jgi:hypothetical protein
MKRIIFECVLVIIIAVLALVIIERKPHTDTYTQDIKPYITAIEHQPQTSQQFIDAFNSPLWHKGSYDNKTHIYTGFVSDNWKNITFYDQIKPAHPEHFIFAGCGIDKDLSILYTIGYMQQVYFDNFFAGGYISFNSTSLNSVNVLCGYSF